MTLACSTAGSSTTAGRATTEPITGANLNAAVKAVLAGEAPPADQWPSMGCSIKWKPGNEPDYSG